MDKRVFFLLVVVNGLNYMDRFIVPAVLPLIMSDFAIEHNHFLGGLLYSAFVLGYFSFSPIFGWLGDRYNRPFLMALGLGLWSLATLGSGIATAVWVFIFFRVLVGVGEASFSSISPGYIKDEIRDAVQVNKALSIFFAAIPVGSALGYVVAGWLSSYGSWRSAFFFGGIPGLFLMFLVARLKDHREVTVDRDEPFLAGLRKIVSIPLLNYAILGYVALNITLIGLSTFVTKYGVSIGYEVDAISTQFGYVMLVSGVLGTVGGGRLSSWFAARSSNPLWSMMLFVSVTAFLSVPLIFAAFSVDSQFWFVILIFFAEILAFAGFAPINSVIVMACPQEHLTLTQGFTIFMLNLFGALLTPMAVGLLADLFGLRLALQLTCLPVFLAALLWWLGSRRT